MKLGLISILLTFVVLGSSSSAFAQDTTDAAQKADNLRLELLDVQTKEAELQERIRQLDEDVKPDNIERSLAGIGSTRPEELRERRRRQLELEKDRLLTQLGQVTKTREGLETAIATADTDAYHQSARGTTPPTLDRLLLTQLFQLPKWMTLLILIVPPGLGLVGLIVLIRRLKRSRGSGLVRD